jgi:hypothetical protein
MASYHKRSHRKRSHHKRSHHKRSHKRSHHRSRRVRGGGYMSGSKHTPGPSTKPTGSP